MAIASAMNNQEESNSIIVTNNISINNNKQDGDELGDDDHHEDDMVMPGFRFHPTEEELVEFYLRRKIEGKRFNVELITFLDLYRYDPWELPGLAAIGEKEWYFYVPRDKKYRNGDRPNRVTTSGYWKATGADRSIRSENLRSIGLKKTLVFYSGKAPKGIRTSWIMNEYRLPLHETERLQKAEISLCRVYKRAGVEDHPSLPRSLLTSSSSRGSLQAQNQNEPPMNRAMERSKTHRKSGKTSKTSPSSSNNIALQNHINSYTVIPPSTSVAEASSQNGTPSNIFPSSSNSSNPNIDDDLHKIVNINYSSSSQKISASLPTNNNNLESNHPQYDPNNVLPQFSSSLQPGAFSDRLWDDWNTISEANKDFTNLFK